MIPLMTTLPHNAMLASASPRRRRLVSWLGFMTGVTSVETPEDLASPLAADPPRLVEAIAAEKALAARAEDAEVGLVFAFDTVVVHEGRVLGKPTDAEDAWRMLRELSGGTHEVTTGVALLLPDATAPATFPVTTTVSMRELDDAAIAAWLGSGEALGCAGAYNIEHHLASVADGECYQNVAGLPLCHVYAALQSGALGEPPTGLTAPVAACDAALGRRCQLGPDVCAPEGQSRVATTMSDSSASS